MMIDLNNNRNRKEESKSWNIRRKLKYYGNKNWPSIKLNNKRKLKNIKRNRQKKGKLTHEI